MCVYIYIDGRNVNTMIHQQRLLHPNKSVEPYTRKKNMVEIKHNAYMYMHG